MLETFDHTSIKYQSSGVNGSLEINDSSFFITKDDL